MMRILVTGASGFIGRNLAEAYASSYEVFAPSSSELNLLDEQAVRAYLKAHRFDAVVHSATTRSNRRVAAPPDLLDRNCRMFFNLARNASLFGKMIHLGSGAEYDVTDLPPLVKEDYFDTRVPRDAYGFSKYICAKYIERSEGITELRLFGVFGPYEDYTVRFISNACCRVLKGLPIVIRQDAIFDYLHIADLAGIVRWFLENEPAHKSYNASTGRRAHLTELAQMVADVSGCNPSISVVQPGVRAEYTADNSRLLAELGPYEFRDMRAAIGELYDWYQQRHSTLDIDLLRFDDVKRGQ